MIALDDFVRMAECSYKDEKYLVRDNGAVLRLPKNNKPRPLDNTWTFGKVDLASAYLKIGGIAVHRIVAIAFCGEAPSPQHVVDHIDTNRQNNRPENLRWLTKLENVLLNPITRKRIELACQCSILDFLANPDRYRDKLKANNFAWMGSVSKEEADITLKKLKAWATKESTSPSNRLNDWIFPRVKPMSKASSWENYTDLQDAFMNSQDTLQDLDNTPKEHLDLVASDTTAISSYYPSLNKNALQEDWRTPSSFPLCPDKGKTIEDYYSNLSRGEIFSVNQYCVAQVCEYGWTAQKDRLIILGVNIEGGIKPHLVCGIRLEDGAFIHTNLGSYFREDGAKKYYTIARGLEWMGGEVFDDRYL